MLGKPQQLKLSQTGTLVLVWIIAQSVNGIFSIYNYTSHRYSHWITDLYFAVNMIQFIVTIIGGAMFYVAAQQYLRRNDSQSRLRYYDTHRFFWIAMAIGCSLWALTGTFFGIRSLIFNGL